MFLRAASAMLDAAAASADSFDGWPRASNVAWNSVAVPFKRWDQLAALHSVDCIGGGSSSSKQSRMSSVRPTQFWAVAGSCL